MRAIFFGNHVGCGACNPNGVDCDTNDCTVCDGSVLSALEIEVARYQREREEISDLVLGVEASLRRLVDALPADADVRGDTLKATHCLVQIRALCGLPAKLVGCAGKLQRAPLVLIDGGGAA